MEKAKTHYDAKKQQNQELQEQLQDLEQLQKENKELRAEAERLGRELQQSGLKTKEAEQACRHLTAQVRSLEAQVSVYLDRGTSPLHCCTPHPPFQVHPYSRLLSCFPGCPCRPAASRLGQIPGGN